MAFIEGAGGNDLLIGTPQSDQIFGRACLLYTSDAADE